MQTNTVFLSDKAQKALQKLAQEQGKSVQDVVNDAIEFYILSTPQMQPQSVGLGQSNLLNLSERVDELLWQD